MGGDRGNRDTRLGASDDRAHVRDGGVNDIGRAIAGLTKRLSNYRVMRNWRREMERLAGERKMALELKGLKGKAMSFRANLDAIGREYDGANEITAEHLADLKALRSQVADMKDDLSAAVDITKNSVDASNAEGAPKSSPVVEPPPPPFPAQ